MIVIIKDLDCLEIKKFQKQISESNLCIIKINKLA